MAGLFRIPFKVFPIHGPETRRDELLDVLTIALTAAICGAESCVDFALFARDRRALFAEFLDLKSGLPSHDTFSRLFHLLAPVAFARCFEQFLGHLGEDGAGVWPLTPKPWPTPCAAIGVSRPPSIGCSTPPSTRTAPARTMARKTSPSCASSPSVSYAPRKTTTPSVPDESGLDGPTTTPVSSSPKCDSRGFYGKRP